MNTLHALILGVVEGITEFLPISSTGHLILTSTLLRIPQTEFVKSFEIVIQLGAIASVVVLYWRSLWDMKTIKRLIVGFLPTGIIGFTLYPLVKSVLIGNTSVVLWTLLIGGIVLVVFERVHRESSNSTAGIAAISYRQAALIGCAQAIAIIPGVSRSAATIVGGLLLGLSRKTIVEFSFLLAVPTMLAASVLDLVKHGSSFSTDQFGVLAVGFVASFLVAWASIVFLLRYIQRHSFTLFGVYRVIVAIVFWIAVT